MICSSFLSFFFLQKELKIMATEGFLFAKLPNCHRMPQIQNWIMYRKGFVFTEKEKGYLRFLHNSS